MSLNKVMLIGNVGREPEVRYVDNNMPVARISLATSEKAYTLKNGTQVPERTEWHRIVAWRDTAQFVEKFVHTGDKIFVEGQLRTRAYNDKNGIQRNVTEIMAERIERLSPRAVQTNEDNTSLPQNGEQKL
jgi:single-strand DNA-binding protein